MRGPMCEVADALEKEMLNKRMPKLQAAPNFGRKNQEFNQEISSDTNSVAKDLWLS